MNRDDEAEEIDREISANFIQENYTPDIDPLLLMKQSRSLDEMERNLSLVRKYSESIKVTKSLKREFVRVQVPNDGSVTLDFSPSGLQHHCDVQFAVVQGCITALDNILGIWLLRLGSEFIANRSSLLRNRWKSMGTPKLSRRAMIRISLISALGAAAAGSVFSIGRMVLGWGRPAPPSWKIPLAPPILGAHRGGGALFPENTLEAFTASRDRFGCRFMEVDTHATRDGVPVVIHDPTVDRTTNGTGPVLAHSLEELQRLDAGFRFRGTSGIGGTDSTAWAGRGIRIPTLAEVLLALPDGVISIEVKQHDPPMEASVVEAVRRAGMQNRVLLGSSRHGTFLRIQALAPEIPSFFSYRSSIAFFIAAWSGLARWFRPPHNALMIPPDFGVLQLITPGIVRTAHRLGLPVIVWTVNDPEEMERLLRMGVDGIITDRPDLLAAVIEERPESG